MAKITDGPSGQGREQVLELVAGQRDQPSRWWLAGAFGKGNDHQEGVGQTGSG